jgi:hypothetical protein
MDNMFRAEPFKIESIPTILKMKEVDLIVLRLLGLTGQQKKEVGRLVEAEINSKLSAFVQTDV